VHRIIVQLIDKYILQVFIFIPIFNHSYVAWNIYNKATLLSIDTSKYMYYNSILHLKYIYETSNGIFKI